MTLTSIWLSYHMVSLRIWLCLYYDYDLCCDILMILCLCLYDYVYIYVYDYVYDRRCQRWMISYVCLVYVYLWQMKWLISEFWPNSLKSLQNSRVVYGILFYVFRILFWIFRILFRVKNSILWTQNSVQNSVKYDIHKLIIKVFARLN